MKITLIRHAEVDISKYSLAYAYELKEWLDIYNNAEIKKHFVSKDEIAKIFDSTNKIFCSQLKRSADSVLLYEKEIDEKYELFNEAGLPNADWGLVKLPLVIWASVFRVMWLFGYQHNGESLSQAKARASRATDLLVESAKKDNSITLLGHGLMNRLIARELVKRGWSSQNKMGSDNWDYGVFISSASSV
jgi:broad specificity phosphatase PhoE